MAEVMLSTKSCATFCAAEAATCATPPNSRQIALRTAYSQGYPQNACARTCAGPLLLLSVLPLFSRQKKPRTSLGEGEVRGRIRTARAGSRDLPTLNTTRSIEGLLHPSHALTGALRRKFNANEKNFVDYRHFSAARSVRLVPVVANPRLDQQRHVQLGGPAHQRADGFADLLDQVFAHFQHQFIVDLQDHPRI